MLFCVAKRALLKYHSRMGEEGCVATALYSAGSSFELADSLVHEYSGDSWKIRVCADCLSRTSSSKFSSSIYVQGPESWTRDTKLEPVHYWFRG